jgi:lipopolysaccharide/colanic/teichoic acid biosynthesis glycosyltransferase
MRKTRFQLWIQGADLFWITIALFCADVLRYGTDWGTVQREFVYSLMPLLLVVWAVWGGLSARMHLDGFSNGWHLPATVSILLLGVSSLMTVILATSYLSRRYVSRLALAYLSVLLLIGFVAIRYGARLVLRARHRAGKVGRVVIIGNGQIARELASKIDRHPEMLCRVVGFLYPQDASENLDTAQTAEIGSTTWFSLQVADMLRSQQVDELMLAMEKPSWPELLNLTARCRSQGIGVSLVPQPYDLYLSRPDLLDLSGLPLLRFGELSTSGIFSRWKRVLDVIATILLAPLAIPLVLSSAIVLRSTKGKGFRWETRCGKNSRAFAMLRLNVDRHAEELTHFERLLKQLSITELPQLFNVLRGDMSLVGPRPESLEQARHYTEWEQQRLGVKPGITGLAQVHGLREEHSSQEKTHFDLQYLLHPSPLGDLSILLQTLWTLLIRMFNRSGPGRANVSQAHVAVDFPPASIKEALQHAHRPQSGTN